VGTSPGPFAGQNAFLTAEKGHLSSFVQLLSPMLLWHDLAILAPQKVKTRSHSRSTIQVHGEKNLR
jgi:hypothetical protein